MMFWDMRPEPNWPFEAPQWTQLAEIVAPLHQLGALLDALGALGVPLVAHLLADMMAVEVAVSVLVQF